MSPVLFSPYFVSSEAHGRESVFLGKAEDEINQDGDKPGMQDVPVCGWKLHPGTEGAGRMPEEQLAVTAFTRQHQPSGVCPVPLTFDECRRR